MSDFDPTVYGTSGIAGEYEDLYESEWDTAGAVDRIAELAAGGPVVEFGIGTGRLALPLAARGVRVHGVDASIEMIAELRRKRGGAEIPVVVGNFAEATAGTGFSLVVLAFNTIYALPDQQAQVACFANAARHLRPGGAFVIEAWVPDLGAFRNNRLVRPRIVRGDKMSIEVAELDSVEQMIRTTQAVFSGGTARVYPANHRYAWPSELDLMAQLAGMRREARWADWRGATFTNHSQAHVTTYRLP